eukprot:CAMPEP_0194715118 /NCGR_PEP_ID=MMETSP0296-20130528/6819_1 /TAXON_ID=39354 /ORGANISM="Heterosigma akashiwo, Strain CCMP2393" /LENGTH=42 /DNA_ID= /DNA_START= /DNA_END= /DNA_ORIENTATION=
MEMSCASSACSFSRRSISSSSCELSTRSGGGDSEYASASAPK